MNLNKWGPFALIAISLTLVFGSRIPWDKVVPDNIVPVVVDTKEIEGATLLLIHEKLNAPIDETLEVRRASAFAAEHKLAGFLDVDEEDDFVGAALADIKAKLNLVPPVLVAVKPQGDSFKVIRVRKWSKSLEDILK